MSNGLVASEKTNCGANPWPNGSPFASVIRTSEKIPPSAFATPGTRSTRSSSEAENGGGSLVSWATISFGVTITSVPSSAAEKMSSKDRLIVSVRM